MISEIISITKRVLMGKETKEAGDGFGEPFGAKKCRFLDCGLLKKSA
jgi:hypothetical protein